MFAIASEALYTTLRKRGTTRQLAGVIVICVISALLLLPAISWYNLRFTNSQGVISVAEVQVLLAYVALCGWILPLSVTATYCLYTLPRLHTNSVYMPSQRRASRTNAATVLKVPRHQPGVPTPFVYHEEAPWGWLEYAKGNFQGQRLALKRSIVTIGREEDNDIWIDDEMASRHHAELAWVEGKVYITDLDSLNGVLLNGVRIHGSEAVEPTDLIEVGSQHFTFIKADPPSISGEQDDPLVRHKWRNASSISEASKSGIWVSTEPLRERKTQSVGDLKAVVRNTDANWGEQWQETAAIHQTPPVLPSKVLTGMLVIRTGEMAGRSFRLDRPVITAGRGFEVDIVINDASVSRRHAQFSRQSDGDYVQDLASRNGTKVNDKPLRSPYLLKAGDVICLGNVYVHYSTTAQGAQSPSMPFMSAHPTSPSTISTSGPVPLKLPSRQKK